MAKPTIASLTQQVATLSALFEAERSSHDGLSAAHEALAREADKLLAMNEALTSAVKGWEAEYAALKAQIAAKPSTPNNRKVYSARPLDEAAQLAHDSYVRARLEAKAKAMATGQCVTVGAA